MGFTFSINLGRSGLKNRFSKSLFSLLNATPQYNDYTDETEKIQAVLSNPAALKVFALQCDLFSLATIKIKKDDKDIENDPFQKLVNNPNPFQSQRQFLWDFMFWNMIGNAVLYIKSGDVDRDNNTMYFLDTSRIFFSNKLQEKIGNLVLSKKGFKDIQEERVEYKNKNGKSNFFKIKELLFITDLTNSTGNWFKGNSRLDALYKIISNSEAGIDSKNINARYLGKYIVNGKVDETNVNLPMMKNDEKKEIEDRIDGNKKVHAVKTPIDIKRFIERSEVLENLDKSYLADYYKIGKMYGIPRDVLEAYESSTYENQEKARGSHVSYTLSPKGCDLGDSVAKRLEYTNEGKIIYLDWSHLPFMQVFKKEEAKVNETNAKSLEKLIKAGVKPESAAKMLGMDVEFKTASNGN
ncbi:Contig93, whole genome shotgun sequence [Tenacibaculum maritimum]|uniref:phage portal protein n=1 Tax=Tenacibaculum maritimum TaxID=107401 RepID=UPI0012E4E152|nr:phage portal protein [Tenacibaculum maritimum]CAA0144186.1 Contig93, whole genome shotgun sequence [Tenacibaculum maritimum]